MQCPHGLGIELFVVRRGAHIDRSCELHTQETSAARGICQYIRLIGGGDEGGTTGKVLYMTAIRSFDLYRRQGDDILQETLLCLWRDLIKLVEVDEQHLRHLLEHLSFVVHL